MSAREQRRLAAIVAADLVGYSRLMGRDESGTVARLRQVRAERLQPVLNRRGGRIVKLTGDGALIEFASAVEALSAAIEFQQTMAEGEAIITEDQRMVFRVGVHLGDVIVDGDDLYGDGVNVAARLEAEAPPGGIVISGDMHNATASRLSATFEDLGRLTLKNIERPVQAYAVHWHAADWPVAAPATEVRPTAMSVTSSDVPLPLPDKPSIAVLPFQNMSGDPEQEYFADGMVEDIITALSRFKSLFVIARNSSFSYKGKSPDVRQVGRDLSVRYVLEGSMRKVGGRVRITAQLIEANIGSHVWAERYDRVIEDIFDLQEEITRSIVAAITPEIETAELSRSARKRPENLGAYEIAMRANADLNNAYDQANEHLRASAVEQAKQALKIDPQCTLALVVIADALWQHVNFRTAPDVDAAYKEGLAAANKAVQIDPLNHLALRVRGVLRFWFGQRQAGLDDLRHAVQHNPNDAIALSALAFCEAAFGNAAKGIECGRLAFRLSPNDRRSATMCVTLANAYFYARRYQEGIETALVAVRDKADHVPANAILAMNLVGAGQIDDARKAMNRIREIAPAYLEKRLSGVSNIEQPEDRQREITFLRVAAGLEDPSTAEALR